MPFKGKGIDPKFHNNDQKLQEPLFLKLVEKESSFDIIEFCKSSQIQITRVEYLKLNPKELDRLLQFVKGNNAQWTNGTQQSVNAILPSRSNELVHPLVCEKIPEIIALQTDVSTPLLESKIEPFYISLFINGHRLNNYIIDSGSSDNIIPSIVAKELGLSLTKNFGKCFSYGFKTNSCARPN